MSRTMDGRGNQVGWYGKVPSLGDFVRHGLPDPLVEHWDTWLQRALLHGRHARGAGFDAALQALPTWRFFIPPLAIDAHAWCGVLQSSADRVGRTFPLILAQPVHTPASSGPGYLFDSARLEPRLDAIAKAGVAALNPQSMRGFEMAVANLDAPLVFAAMSDPTPWQDDEGEAATARIGWTGATRFEGRLDDLLRRSAETRLATWLSGRTLWWIPSAADEHGALLTVSPPYPDELLLTLIDAA